MDDGLASILSDDDVCTLLAVRPDGVAPVVDLAPWTELAQLRRRARSLLREHESCDVVELWRGGSLVERVPRA